MLTLIESRMNFSHSTFSHFINLLHLSVVTILIDRVNSHSEYSRHGKLFDLISLTYFLRSTFSLHFEQINRWFRVAHNAHSFYCWSNQTDVYPHRTGSKHGVKVNKKIFIEGACFAFVIFFLRMDFYSNVVSWRLINSMALLLALSTYTKKLFNPKKTEVMKAVRFASYHLIVFEDFRHSWCLSANYLFLCVFVCLNVSLIQCLINACESSIEWKKTWWCRVKVWNTQGKCGP